MKIKRVSIVFISLVTVAALLSGLALTTAKGPGLRYKGTFDTWYFKPDTSMYEDEKIVDSQWKIMIKGDKAVFNAKQVELNIQSETPGTYDYHEIEMKSDDVQSTANGYIISGIVTWVKNEIHTYTLEAVITVDESNYQTQFIMEIRVPAGSWTYPGSFLP